MWRNYANFGLWMVVDSGHAPHCEIVLSPMKPASTYTEVLLQQLFSQVFPIPPGQLCHRRTSVRGGGATAQK